MYTPARPPVPHGLALKAWCHKDSCLASGRMSDSLSDHTIIVRIKLASLKPEALPET